MEMVDGTAPSALFFAVAEELHFTRAAERLCTSSVRAMLIQVFFSPIAQQADQLPQSSTSRIAFVASDEAQAGKQRMRDRRRCRGRIDVAAR
ncbi:hypothetical protein [Variovorax sp. E3]|uniref:hypothetical protein n=1 Tax=Variovorax sp. E3 TaxID=1914993 RepID=UPI0018DB3955|nr:hypothetical protein [Variovorax sp. E3]